MADTALTTEPALPGANWRFWSVSFGGLLLVVILAPAVIGLFTERLIHQKIEKINRNSPLEITVSYYQAGWLSSRMLSQVNVPGLGVSANFSHRIDHGPLSIRELVGGKASLRLATVITQPLEQSSGVKTARAAGSRFTSLIDFNGNIVTTAAPFSRQPSPHKSNGWMVKTDRLTWEADWHSQSSAFSGWTRFGHARVVSNQHQFAFTNVFARANTLAGAQANSADMHVKMGDMSYASDNRKFELTGNRLQISSDSDRDSTNLRLQGTVSRLRWRGGEVTDVEFDVTLRAPPQAIQLTRVDSVARDASDDEPREAGHANRLFSILRTSLRFLPSSSELEVANLTFLHRNREVSGWLRVNSPTALSNSGASGMETLLGNLTLQAELVAEESLVFDLLESRTRDIINRSEQFGAMETFSDEEAAPLVVSSVESQLAVLERQRYLDRQGGYYSTRIALHGAAPL